MDKRFVEDLAVLHVKIDNIKEINEKILKHLDEMNGKIYENTKNIAKTMSDLDKHAEMNNLLFNSCKDSQKKLEKTTEERLFEIQSKVNGYKIIGTIMGGVVVVILIFLEVKYKIFGGN